MKDIQVYAQNGSDTGRTVSLDPGIFDIEPNDHVIWLDVRSVQANMRQGTHKTKERGEVRGGGAKPWRQKGTGRARVGTIRSPLWTGGGRVFGPRPHGYNVRVNRKTKQLARRSALTYKARADAFRVIEDFQMDAPKTRDMAGMLQALELTDKKVLVLTAGPDANVYKSGRNLPKCNVRDAASASTLDLLDAHVVLCQEGALQVLTSVLGNGSGADQ